MLSELIVEREFETETNFELNYHSITMVEEFWTYTEKVLIPGLYYEGYDDTGIGLNRYPRLKLYENLQNMDNDRYLLMKENILIGPPRIRQIRVRNDSCNIHKLFQKQFHLCYGQYLSKNEDFGSFGLGNGTPWVYHGKEHSGGISTWGILHTYPAGGYYQDLYYDALETKLLLRSLRKNNWIDRGTRAVFIEFTVYNVNTNLFCIVQLIVEIPATGGVIPSVNMYTLKLLRFVSPMDYFVLVCEVLYGLQVLYYTVEELYEIKIEKLSYFSRFWNWIDLAIITVI